MNDSNTPIPGKMYLWFRFNPFESGLFAIFAPRSMRNSMNELSGLGTLTWSGSFSFSFFFPFSFPFPFPFPFSLPAPFSFSVPFLGLSALARTFSVVDLLPKAEDGRTGTAIGFEAGSGLCELPAVD